MKILYLERPLDGSLDGNPHVTLMTDSSVARNRRPLYLPPVADNWVMSIGIGVRINRLGKFIGERFGSRYYDAVTAVARLRPADTPCDVTSATMTAFDGSLTIGDWLTPEKAINQSGTLTVGINGQSMAAVTVASMDIDRAVAWLSRYFTIKMGDIIVVGDSGAETVPGIGDRIIVTIGTEEVIELKIK